MAMWFRRSKSKPKPRINNPCADVVEKGHLFIGGVCSSCGVTFGEYMHDHTNLNRHIPCKPHGTLPKGWKTGLIRCSSFFHR